MLLLTGATGSVGSVLLPKLLAHDMEVRCLVRDPRRLGPQRVRVQIALGDLADPRSFRNALRGVDTVVHLAASSRDQPRGSIEELAIMATWWMLQAAQRAGVERFVFFSVLGASTHSSARLFRAKALAEQLVRAARLRCTVVAPSLVYAPGDRRLALIERLGLLPVVPLPGSAQARCQPIWADDVADCVISLLRQGEHREHSRHELAGPDTLTYDQVIRMVLSAAGRGRRLVHVPPALAARALGVLEGVAGDETPLTWDEAELLRAESVCAGGVEGAQALGVRPRRMATVLGLS
jgi:uncharacterized protein YbjT (DUF2867 family)